MDIFKEFPATADNPNGFCREPISEIKDYMSYSRLKMFNKSPRHYWWRYVLGNKPKETDAKDEGKLIHKCILETDDFLERLKVRPDKGDYQVHTKDDLAALGLEIGVEFLKSDTKPKMIQKLLAADPSVRGMIYDCAIADFEEELRESDLVVTPDQANRFVNIVKSVSSHPTAHKLLDGRGWPEVCAYWWDEELGVLWRLQLDYVTILNGRIYIIDAKSTQDASENGFQRDIAKHGYHFQGWLYPRAIAGITGMPVQMAFLAVEKEEPYNSELYYPATRQLETTYWQVGRLLARWRRCIDTGVWQGYTDGKITPIDLPNWMHYQIEEQADKELDQ